MKPFLIRFYQDADRPLVQAMSAALQDYIAGMDPLSLYRKIDTFDAQTYFDLILEDLKKGGFLLVAESQNKVVGHALVFLGKASTLDLVEKFESKVVFLSELYIQTEFQKQGLGTALLKKVEEYSKELGFTGLQLSCFKQNGGAHEFYLAQGYEDRSYEMYKKLA